MGSIYFIFMFTHFLQTSHKTFFFRESSGESTLSPVEKQKETTKLTEAQKQIIDRVIQLLERDPEVEKSMNLAFRKNFQEMISHPDQLKALLDTMGQKKNEELTKIEKNYKSGELSSEQALEESRDVIMHYIKMQIETTKKEFENNHQS